MCGSVGESGRDLEPARLAAQRPVVDGELPRERGQFGP
jgi:hypothetical protein